MNITQLVAAGLFLAIAFIVDIRKQIIPNWLTAASFAAAIVYHAVLGGMEGITAALIGAAAGFFPLLLLHLAKGIGAGDVKLFAALGAWLGVWTVLQVLLYSILYAGAIGICLVIMNRTFGKRLVEGQLLFLCLLWAGGSSNGCNGRGRAKNFRLCWLSPLLQ